MQVTLTKKIKESRQVLKDFQLCKDENERPCLKERIRLKRLIDDVYSIINGKNKTPKTKIQPYRRNIVCK